MRRSYRNRNPHTQDKTKEPFFNNKTKSKTGDSKPFFQTKGLKVDSPGDKYEQEADSMANAVVNQAASKPQIQQKEMGAIQRESLATPLEDEKLGTAEQRMEEDKMIQEKPEVQREEENEKEDEVTAQKMEEEEEKQEIRKMDLDEEKEEGTPAVQTKADTAGVGTAGASVSTQITNSAGRGKPMNAKTKAEMEASFGSNFNGVNIHTDQPAIEMNKKLHAQAFTHGKDIYFNSGKYNPDTVSGKRLLAHELTHVVQQNGLKKKSIQRITCRNSSATAPARATAGQSNRLDQRARSIVSIASNTQYSNLQKATRLITAMVCHYYPQHAGLIRNISYNASEAGLHTTSVGRGSGARGDIEVGNYFITNTNSRRISRRVLQVGHELRHILQYRQGLTGGTNQNEREFLAFHENALADEFVGTGRMSRATRRSLIDAALGYYYCLSQQKQTQYDTQKQELLTRRQQINQRAGTGRTTAPTSCAHP